MDWLQRLVEGYVAVVVFDSLVAALTLQALMRLWGVSEPSSQARYHLLTLLLPLAAYPIYRLAYPDWGSERFRQDIALVDLRQWFALHAADLPPFLVLLAIFMVLTTVLFLTQELGPSLRHHLGLRQARPAALAPDVADEAGCWLRVSARGMPVKLALADTPDPIAFVTGWRNHTLVLSRSLVRLLTPDELQGVLAHELGHLAKRDNWLRGAAMLMRLAMFYNPVALYAFRMLIRATEMASDAHAVALTGKPRAFAGGLLKVHMAAEQEGMEEARRSWLATHADGWNREAQRGLLKERVERVLEGRQTSPAGPETLRLAAAALAVMGLLFFIV